MKYKKTRRRTEGRLLVALVTCLRAGLNSVGSRSYLSGRRKTAPYVETHVARMCGCVVLSVSRRF
ncbi:hypothetical protein IAD21_02742 [Abditibacteriota bacterium]|nr:hypothetical protein IAD21_02742 [Abditibacteriota bacterium]